MSEEKIDSVEPQENVGGVSEESSAESLGERRADSVKYDTYKRTLSEAKKYKNLYGELNDKFTMLEQNQMEAEGKKDELIESLRKQLGEVTQRERQMVGNFAYKTISSEIVDEAVKMGCTNTKLLMKAVEDDLKTLDYDDNFSVDKEQVKALLERTKQDHSILFNKPAPSVKDGTPRAPELKEDKSLDGLSLKEKAHLLAKLDRTGKF